MDVHNQSR